MLLGALDVRGARSPLSVPHIPPPITALALSDGDDAHWSVEDVDEVIEVVGI